MKNNCIYYTIFLKKKRGVPRFTLPKLKGENGRFLNKSPVLTIYIELPCALK